MSAAPQELIFMEETPVLTLLRSMREDEQSFLRNEQARRDLIYSTWIETMLNPMESTITRMRASELCAKADGLFVERKEIGLSSGFRDMVLSLGGQLKELAPLTENAMQCADAMEV